MPTVSDEAARAAVSDRAGVSSEGDGARTRNFQIDSLYDVEVPYRARTVGAAPVRKNENHQNPRRRVVRPVLPARGIARVGGVFLRGLRAAFQRIRRVSPCVVCDVRGGHAGYCTFTEFDAPAAFTSGSRGARK